MTTPSVEAALVEALLQAIVEARDPSYFPDCHYCDWILSRASELAAARPARTSPPTHSAGDAVRALDRMTNACRNILAKQTIIADMAQRIEFWNAVEEAEALSAAHHARKPKEEVR